MASQTQVTLVDDIDGSQADETVRFGLDGVNYEIDLSSANAQVLRNAINSFTQHSRQITRSGKAKKVRTGPDPKEVRTWARNQGIDVSERGRLSAAIINSYNHAIGLTA